MRYLLTVSIILLGSCFAYAQSGESMVAEMNRTFELQTVTKVAHAAPMLEGGNGEDKNVVYTLQLSHGEPQHAILYKMKENIIRRALSFTPRKKWLKWV